MSRNKRRSVATEVYAGHLNGGRDHAFNPNVDRAVRIERMYERILTELAMNRFKWEGLPEEIDVRFLEKTLFYNALSVCYFDEDYDKYFALPGTGQNYLNWQEEPTGFTVVGQNTFGSKTLGADKVVPIWANKLRYPDLDVVQIYAYRLAHLDRTTEINSENSRHTKFVVSGENQRLSVRNANRQIAEGQNGIEVAGPLQDLEFIQVLDNNIPADTIEKGDIVATRQWNKAMTLLGIDNANQDKTERLVGGESDSNNDQIDSMRFVNLNERRKAAKLMNKKFGWKVEVNYYTVEERKAEQEAANDREEEVVRAADDSDDKADKKEAA